MNYSKYYEARDMITEILKKDFLGPLEEDEVICDERPLDYYIIGKLYPQKNDADNTTQSSADDCGTLDEEDCISLCNGRNPSSFGISFSLNKEGNSFNIDASAAKYVLIDREEAKKKLQFDEEDYKKAVSFWQRIKLKTPTISIEVSSLEKGKNKKEMIDDNLSVNILLHKMYEDGSKMITVTMVNENESSSDYKEECLNSFFQPEISITSGVYNAFGDIRRNVYINNDAEIKELDMLYNSVSNYASGHGCAVCWETDESNIAIKLKTEFLPSFEVKQMMPTADFKHNVLSMKYLSEASTDDIIDGLRQLTHMYEKWIKEQYQKAKTLHKKHNESAQRNLKKCTEALNRLNKAINELGNPKVFKAFSLANKAMFLQRKKMLMNTERFEEDYKIKWYPFQLAFFLQEIYSFSKPDSDERKDVDLLWFPTGGGKTEAYLGIAAFVIFLRRLTKGALGDGVTILMRYTLRLLSFQQFERAAALICACEIIRKEQNIPGGEIGIGLWAGKALTPNKIEMADKILKGERDEEMESSNPAQIEKCPWCGKIIPPKEPYYVCDIKGRRMNIYCSNTKCEFRSGLPLYLIDEEIYEHMPTFIVATIDKFAQVALNSDTACIFGVGKNKIPPELIIQDELHLISGPLGTITGLYEAAVKKLCERNGHYPKVVASTATIRNAKEQIKALYASEYTQFPPQGIDINDSFFAQISSRNERPARQYFGCMAIGTSPTTMMIRVMASMLFATRYLIELGYDEKIIDSFWTLTGYFNTLRELGGAIIRVVDDIQDRFAYLKNRKFKELYPLKCGENRYDRYKELTSREKSENIGNVIQNELKEPYKADGSTVPYDFLLCSNMISVGVDVGRLGMMVVVGQPKTTSEYIQATSRVGRETPGLVITTYNQAKSRDRSHYEQFTQYHETFYRYVEATSVTPFSDRARDRALQTLFVILCRYTIPDLLRDSDAVNFKRNMKGIREVRDYIHNYVSLVDPDECDNVREEINEIEEEWERKAYRKDKLKYRKTRYINQKDVLFEPDYDEYSRFRVLNTMRSVETTVKVITKE
jgi:hypothetical protein